MALILFFLLMLKSTKKFEQEAFEFKSVKIKSTEKLLYY